MNAFNKSARLINKALYKYKTLKNYNLKKSNFIYIYIEFYKKLKKKNKIDNDIYNKKLNFPTKSI